MIHSLNNSDVETVENIRFVHVPGQSKPSLVTRHHTWKDKFITCYRQMNESGKWVGDCPLCWVYNELWKKSDQASYGGRERLVNMAHQIKPSIRHRFLAIDRANEGAGVKVFYCGNVVANIIYRGLPKIEISDWKTWLQRKLDLFLIGLNFKDPPDLSVFSTTHGHDFRYIKILVKSMGCYCPTYDHSTFVRTPSPLGTKTQVVEWEDQAIALVNKGFRPSYSNLWALVEDVQDEYCPLGFKVPSEYDVIAPKFDWTMEQEI